MISLLIVRNNLSSQYSTSYPKTLQRVGTIRTRRIVTKKTFRFMTIQTPPTTNVSKSATIFFVYFLLCDFTKHFPPQIFRGLEAKKTTKNQIFILLAELRRSVQRVVGPYSWHSAWATQLQIKIAALARH